MGELLREVVAEELERLSEFDDRLELVTVTAVEPDPDNRQAKVFLSSMREETEEALAEHRVRIQAAVARQSRLKRTPRLTFLVDSGVQTGTRVEEILRGLKKNDED